jgi:hypothetical protein
VVIKIRRYSSLRKLGEKGDCGNRGLGTTKIKFGSLHLFRKGQTAHTRRIQSFSTLVVVLCFSMEILQSIEVLKSGTNPNRPIYRDVCPQINQCLEFRQSRGCAVF